MRAFVPVLIAALVLPLSVAVSAQPVILAGKVVCHLADPGTYGSVTARAAAVDQRIAQAISVENVGEPKMLVAKKNGLWSVYIGKTYLVSVYPQDAKQAGVSAKKLAWQWASNFKRIFPDAEPVVRYRARLAAGGHLPTHGDSHASAKRPPVKVPKEHWGLMDRYLLLLWDARTAKEEDRASADAHITGEILEISSLHYFAAAVKAQGHEPGKCPSLRACQKCQADMAAAIAVSPDKQPQAADLARALSADAAAKRAVKQAILYSRQVDKPRFFSERARIAWILWRRLKARADVLLQQAHPVAPTSSTATRHGAGLSASTALAAGK
ncbi:MAG: hypothetical protein J7M26_08690 [Armatimonadetes bacterium]|nr:hypothetical protein [Armatimonadota bacterium]